MMSTIETYSVLTTSRIEGIEPMCAKFQTIFANVKKKPYDILDHRKIDFDTDFEDFKSSIYDLEVGGSVIYASNVLHLKENILHDLNPQSRFMAWIYINVTFKRIIFTIIFG